jgi:5-methylcytosine-specific restriction endonuclease McrA
MSGRKRTVPHDDWREWYKFEKWRKMRAHQLRTQPLCKFCMAMGKVVPAEIADHITPHRGNWTLFWTGPLQSLCKQCHDREKRYTQGHGYRRDIGLDGWPVDPNHPANRKIG